MISMTRLWKIVTILIIVGCGQRLLNYSGRFDNLPAALSLLRILTSVTTGPSPSASINLEPRVHEPARAEYAVRWDPSEGGFSNAQEVLAFLDAPKTAGQAFEVRYFDLAPPVNAPPNSITILRQRSRAAGKTEFRLKYRRAQPLGDKWECPNDAPYEKTEEVDVSFVGTERPRRVYSYSCTLTAELPPASLGAVPKKCASRMVRYHFGGFKIEEWTLPGGNVKVEISHAARNSSDEVVKFAEFVSKLRGRGVKPSDQSKTELGSRCP
jgi:hypothetical protein